MDVEGAAEPMVIAEIEDEVQGMPLMGQESRTVPPYRRLRLGLGLFLASGLLVMLVGRQSSTIHGSIEAVITQYDHCSAYDDCSMISCAKMSRAPRGKYEMFQCNRDRCYDCSDCKGKGAAESCRRGASKGRR